MRINDNIFPYQIMLDDQVLGSQLRTFSIQHQCPVLLADDFIGGGLISKMVLVCP